MRTRRGISAWSYLKVGDVLKAQGDLSGALNNYLDSLRIRRRRWPSTTQAIPSGRAISAWSYQKVGDVLKVQGDLSAALEELPRLPWNPLKLAKQDPGNAVWQRELAAG